MSAAEVSNDLKSGYVFNINLPSWQTPANNTPTPSAPAQWWEKNKGLVIGAGVLLLVVVAIFLVKRKKS